MKSYRTFKAQILRNKKIKGAYEELGPEFAFARMIIEKRIKNGLTQKELAKKIGTKQSAIARLESGEHNATLAFLQRVADALGTRLKVSL